MNKLFIKRDTCPTCTSSNFTTIYSRPYDFSPLYKYLEDTYSDVERWNISSLKSYHYSLVKCQNCDLIFQVEVPSSEFMSQIYDTNFSVYPCFSDDINYYAIYSQDIIQIVSFLGKPSSTLKVLDLGMGWGRWALMAKAFGCEVYGAELSSQRLKYAESNGIKCLTFDEISDHQFDFINTDQVVEHLAHPLEVIRELTQSLKPNGIIKVCVPNSFGIRFRLKYMDWDAPKGSIKSLNPVAPLEHINCFYRKSMLELAKLAGLKEVKMPLLMQYQCSTLWNNPKKILRNLIMPLYRNVLGLQNYYLFQLK